MDDISSLLQGVMNSKVASLLYGSMSAQQREDRRVPDSTRRAFLSRMRMDAVTSRQGAQNMEDAAAMVTTAQTGVTAIKDMLVKMRKLAVDADSLVNPSQADYDSYSGQLKSWAEQIVKVAKSTQFNGFNLLDGSAGMNSDGVIVLQADNAPINQVLVNFLDSGSSDGINGGLDVSRLDAQMGMMVGPNDDPKRIMALLDRYIDAVSGVEARYTQDIKSLDNLRVLLESRGDIFDNVQKYHTEKPEEQAQSYLDMLMSASQTNGSIFSGRG